jgi:metal-responsive CopG/Arc/MetJ family transcriptional regulator
VGRPHLGLKNVMTRLPEKLLERIDRIMRLTGVSRSAIVRIGTEKEVEKREKELKKSKD